MSAAERRWNARGSLQVLAVFALLLVLRGLLLPGPAWAEQDHSLVSIEAQSEDVRQVLQQLAATAGINLVVDDSLTPPDHSQAAECPPGPGVAVHRESRRRHHHLRRWRLSFPQQSQHVCQPQPPAEPATVQVLDLSQTDYGMALQLIQAVAGSLKVEGFPELKAVVISGPYNQVNTVRSAIEVFLRSRPGQAAPQQQVLQVVPLSYADPYETASAVQGQFSSVRGTGAGEQQLGCKRATGPGRGCSKRHPEPRSHPGAHRL